jgi:hypothetical protein
MGSLAIQMQKWGPLRLVTLAAGVIDEPLPAAARLSRGTLSVVTATSEERVPETPPYALGRGSRFGALSIFISCVGYRTKGTPLGCQDDPATGESNGGGVTMLMLLTDFVLFSGSAPCITGIVIAVASLLS